MRNQGEVLLQFVGNSSETMPGAGEEQWGEGWIYSAHRDRSICTEGAIPGAGVYYFLLRTLLVFSNKWCARARPVVTKWHLRLLHALCSFGRREFRLLPEVMAANIAKGLPPFHLFSQQLFNARAESSQCPQTRQKGGPSSSVKAARDRTGPTNPISFQSKGGSGLAFWRARILQAFLVQMLLLSTTLAAQICVDKLSTLKAELNSQSTALTY